MSINHLIGLGDPQAAIQIYIANRPPLDFYQQLDSTYAMSAGEINDIADKTGNHWRKIFNVYAKLWFELFPSLSNSFDSWQAYRDKALLQKNSQTCLLFNEIVLSNNRNEIKVVMGKQYGEALCEQAGINLIWLNERFAVNEAERIIVCPYFDYRQLSNTRIDYLVCLLKKLKD